LLTEVRYLADSSAIARLTSGVVVEMMTPLIDAAQVATCGVVDLELLAAVRESDVRKEVQEARAAAFPWLETRDEDLRRALFVQSLIAAQGQPSRRWSPLVVAAVAERHQIGVLHYDPDFDRIAAVTGQEVRWVCPRGSPAGCDREAIPLRMARED
jgi:predicted nucleic acid-binding protein